MCYFEQFHLFNNQFQNLIWKGLWVTVKFETIGAMLSLNKGKLDVKKVLQMSQLKTWLWLKYKLHAFYFGYSDWITNPDICFKISV